MTYLLTLADTDWLLIHATILLLLWYWHISAEAEMGIESLVIAAWLTHYWWLIFLIEGLTFSHYWLLLFFDIIIIIADIIISFIFIYYGHEYLGQRQLRGWDSHWLATFSQLAEADEMRLSIDADISHLFHLVIMMRGILRHDRHYYLGI